MVATSEHQGKSGSSTFSDPGQSDNGKIAGGYRKIAVKRLIRAWFACKSVLAFRIFLACNEIHERQDLNRKSASAAGKQLPRGITPWAVSILAADTGTTQRRVRAALRELTTARVLNWTERHVDFPILDLAGDADRAFRRIPPKRRGNVSVPRRILRHLARHGTKATISSALAHAIRCWGTGGRCSRKFVCEIFGVDNATAKRGRKALVELGWLIEVEPASTTKGEKCPNWWKTNRWGPQVRINIAWKSANGTDLTRPMVEPKSTVSRPPVGTILHRPRTEPKSVVNPAESGTEANRDQIAPASAPFCTGLALHLPRTFGTKYQPPEGAPQTPTKKHGAFGPNDENEEDQTRQWQSSSGGNAVQGYLSRRKTPTAPEPLAVCENSLRINPGYLAYPRDLFAARRSWLFQRFVTAGWADSEFHRTQLDGFCERCNSQDLENPIGLLIRMVNGDEIPCGLCNGTDEACESCQGSGLVYAPDLVTNAEEDRGIDRRKTAEATVAAQLTGMRLGLVEPIAEALDPARAFEEPTLPVLSPDAREMTRFTKRFPGRSWRAFFANSWSQERITATAKEIGLVTPEKKITRSA